MNGSDDGGSSSPEENLKRTVNGCQAAKPADGHLLRLPKQELQE